MGTSRVVFGWCAAFVLALTARGQGLAPRQDVLFEVTRDTTQGQSVFVVGDLPELGSNSTALAVKLVPSSYPTWRATVSLPAGRTYTYRYIVRSDGPGQQNAAATDFKGPFNASTPDQARPAKSKALWLTWGIDQPVMWWRPASPTSGGPFIARPMERFGPAVAGRAGETQWLAWGFHIAGEAFDFYFTDPNGNFRYPATGWYSTNLDGVFVQDGQLYTYVPGPNPEPAKRADPYFRTFFSPQLNQDRGVRVFLPRGYDQHPERRYPVIYFHDGQNIFDQGTFGTWNADDTLAALQASGAMQEVIAVGLDNIGETRRSDYSKPGDNNGRADRYVAFILETVKPFIDANYRTLPDAANTGAIGSSMGGVVSLYMGYDFTQFTRIGSLSTAWWLVPTFTQYIRTEPSRAGLRIWMDVGDTGSTSGGNNNDGYWDSLGVRDALIGGAPGPGQPRYTLRGRYDFAVGFGQNHSEGAWATRLPSTLRFLFPAQGEPNHLLRTLFAPNWDANADGRMSVDDLYTHVGAPTDLNFDGVIDAADTGVLVGFLRRGEGGDVAGGRAP